MDNISIRTTRIIALVLLAVFALTFNVHADETMPVVVRSEIRESSDGGDDLFIEQTFYFNALPRITFNASPCITSSGCMSSDHPKFDCHANRWVMGFSGGMPRIRIPSPHPQAEAVQVQAQAMSNILRNQESLGAVFDAAQYNVQKREWETRGGENAGSRIPDTVAVQTGTREPAENQAPGPASQVVDITHNLNQLAVDTLTGMGKSAYIDSDGAMCGPGIDEITGEELRSQMGNTAGAAGLLMDKFELRVIWRLPGDLEIVPHEVTEAVQQRSIEVDGTQVPVAPPVSPQNNKNLYSQYRREIETLAQVSGAPRQGEPAVANGIRFAGDLYGFALAARRGEEDARRFLDELKQREEAAKQAGFLQRIMLAVRGFLGRVAYAAEPVATPLSWSQAQQMLESATTIPFRETNALEAIRLMSAERLPVLVGYLDNASDPGVVHAVTLLDYDSSKDKFTAFAGDGIVSISWDALMGAQPRFLVGVPPAEVQTP